MLSAVPERSHEGLEGITKERDDNSAAASSSSSSPRIRDDANDDHQDPSKPDFWEFDPLTNPQVTSQSAHSLYPFADSSTPATQSQQGLLQIPTPKNSKETDFQIPASFTSPFDFEKESQSLATTKSRASHTLSSLSVPSSTSSSASSSPTMTPMNNRINANSHSIIQSDDIWDLDPLGSSPPSSSSRTRNRSNGHNNNNNDKQAHTDKNSQDAVFESEGSSDEEEDTSGEESQHRDSNNNNNHHYDDDNNTHKSSPRPPMHPRLHRIKNMNNDNNGSKSSSSSTRESRLPPAYHGTPLTGVRSIKTSGAGVTDLHQLHEDMANDSHSNDATNQSQQSSSSSSSSSTSSSSSSSSSATKSNSSKARRVCSVSDCGEARFAASYCWKHVIMNAPRTPDGEPCSPGTGMRYLHQFYSKNIEKDRRLRIVTWKLSTNGDNYTLHLFCNRRNSTRQVHLNGKKIFDGLVPDDRWTCTIEIERNESDRQILMIEAIPKVKTYTYNLYVNGLSFDEARAKWLGELGQHFYFDSSLELESIRRAMLQDKLVLKAQWDRWDQTTKTSHGYPKNHIEWKFTINKVPHEVTITHSCVSGKRIITVDGKIIYKRKPRLTALWFKHRLTYSFMIGNTPLHLHIVRLNKSSKEPDVIPAQKYLPTVLVRHLKRLPYQIPNLPPRYEYKLMIDGVEFDDCRHTLDEFCGGDIKLDEMNGVQFKRFQSEGRLDYESLKMVNGPEDRIDNITGNIQNEPPTQNAPSA